MKADVALLGGGVSAVQHFGQQLVFFNVVYK